jgi:hypothetical protein
MDRLGEATEAKGGVADTENPARMAASGGRRVSKAQASLIERQERQRQKRASSAKAATGDLRARRKSIEAMAAGNSKKEMANPLEGEDQERLIEVFKNMSGFLQETRASLSDLESEAMTPDMEAQLSDSIAQLQVIAGNQNSGHQNRSQSQVDMDQLRAFQRNMTAEDDSF